MKSADDFIKPPMGLEGNFAGGGANTNTQISPLSNNYVGGLKPNFN